MKQKNKNISYFLISSFLASFGQPAWSSLLGLCAVFFSISLITYVLVFVKNLRVRFFLAALWFFLTQSVQLSWLLTFETQGLYIVFAYGSLALFLSLQFGLFSLFFSKERLNSMLGILCLSSLWVILEYSRLFVFSGFSFNPLGLFLAGNLYSMQLASIAGVYGLSFLVVLINLLTLYTFFWKKAYRRQYVYFSFLFCLLAFSWFRVHFPSVWKEKTQNETRFQNVVLVQTALSIAEKRGLGYLGKDTKMRHPLDQWLHILHLLVEHKKKPIDLIVLPEYVVPFAWDQPFYPLSWVKLALETVLGPEVLDKIPSLDVKKDSLGELKVGNEYWVRCLAHIFNAEIVAGLDFEKKSQGNDKVYASVFHYDPRIRTWDRYDKQVLLPMAEYIPFDWCRKIAARYGIQGSFERGKNSKVFHGMSSMGINVCYEITLPFLVHQNRILGADLLLEVSNDAWYPDTKLPLQHFSLARLRALENGLPLLRACNTGVTVALDGLGKIKALVGKKPGDAEWQAEAIYTPISLERFFTFYSKWGDKFIIYLSTLLSLFLPFLKLKSLIK